MKRLCETILILALLTIVRGSAEAYDDKYIHPEITNKTVKFSKLESYLLSKLGYPKGSETLLNGTSIIDLLKKGATDEDHPMCRASNHFHNPLLSWDQSQLNDSSGFTGWAIHTWCVSHGWLDENRKSAITWATGYETYDGPIVPRTNQDMGWDNARSYFYSALTSTTNTDRETNFAKTFQAGQVMHLLQTMTEAV